MRVLVCGGRDFDDMGLLNKELFCLTMELSASEVTIITGDAVGADWLARGWARWNDVNYKGYPADWKTHGKAAGMIRNKQMLEEGQPDFVVAFSGGAGTANMVELARKASIKVIEIK